MKLRSYTLWILTGATLSAARGGAAQDAVTAPTPLPAALPAATPATTSVSDQRLAAGATAPVLSFADAIALTLQNNPQRAAARAALQAAQARIGTARAAGGLQVGLNGSATANRNFGEPDTFGGGGATTGTGGTGGASNSFSQNFSPDTSESLAATAQLPIYTGGRVKAGKRAAEAAAQVQASQTVQVEQDLVLSAATTYLGILRNEQLLQVAEDNLAVSREQRRVAQVRFDAGAAARLDVLRAATTLADAEQRRVAASGAVAQAKAQLNTLMGRMPETPLRVMGIDTVAPPMLGGQRPAYPTMVDDNGAELRAVAEAHNSTLAAARAQVQQAEANVDVAKAQKKPSLAASLSGTLHNPVTFLGRFSAALGLSIAQTLFDSGRAKSQIAEARALAEQARQGLSGQRLTVANQLEQLLLAADVAVQNLRTTDTAVASAQEAVRATQLGYEAGVRTAVEVNDAQAALLSALTNAVNARFELALARARIASAAGVLTPEWQAAYEAALRDELSRLKPKK